MTNLSDVLTLPNFLGSQYTGVAVTPNGTYVYLLDQSAGLISRLNSSGVNDTTWGVYLPGAGQDIGRWVWTGSVGCIRASTTPAVRAARYIASTWTRR